MTAHRPPPLRESALDAGERRFAERAVRRQRLFLALSAAGLGVAVGLAAYYAYRRWTDPAFGLGEPFVIVLLVLLNARQNLRQHRYARVLGKLLGVLAGGCAPRPGSPDQPASGASGSR